MALKIIVPHHRASSALRGEGPAPLDIDDEKDLIEAHPGCPGGLRGLPRPRYIERTLEYVLDRFPIRNRIMLPGPGAGDPVRDIHGR